MPSLARCRQSWYAPPSSAYQARIGLHLQTSVRLTSPSLGSQPLLLTSLRPMTDQEWFASISSAGPSKSKSKNHNPSKGHRKAQSSVASTASKLASPSSWRNSTASESLATPADQSGSSGGFRRPRSVSASSAVSGVDSDTVAQESERRRKRDVILQKVNKRRRKEGVPTNPGSSEEPGGYSAEDATKRGDDPDVEKHKEDGDRTRGGAQMDEELNEDDPNTGHYVNYQVGFEYQRPEQAKKQGWGLHMLVSPAETSPRQFALLRIPQRPSLMQIGLFRLGCQRRS